jgi:hypothetical protein
MGPIISVLLGLVCGEVIFFWLLRAIVPRLPLSPKWRSRAWRWGIALLVVYGFMLLIVALTMSPNG